MPEVDFKTHSLNIASRLVKGTSVTSLFVDFICPLLCFSYLFRDCLFAQYKGPRLSCLAKNKHKMIPSALLYEP
jgi:hypothetical protein